MAVPIFKEVIAVLRPERWAATKARLERLPVTFSQRRVLGRGRERGLHYLPRAGARAAAIRCLPHRLISFEGQESLVDAAVRAILDANCTGRAGDGRIFVLPVAAAVPMEVETSVAWEMPALPFDTVLPPPAAIGEVVHAAG